MCKDECHKWKYDLYRMYMSILFKSLSVYLKKKVVAFEKSWLYSVVFVDDRESPFIN